ncbi:hypothetical protein HPB49_026204 [Dermacentor silvarum]|nr:hypothetical protein HPB49_026681 [Dermacentor silvarum]KAH7985946.1 hypothetical protein HPB49_026204 [Dermacentor silvarum]
MPDLNKAIQDFDGEGSCHEAGAWLKSIDSMTVLHGWPDSFRLENARLHMKGPARFWLQARVDDLTTWEDFKIAFKNTFVGQTSTAEKWKQMQERVQMKGGSITAYFLEKTLLCKALGLGMQDTKEQVLVGLRFKDACISMSAKDHENEDELLADLRRLERITEARMQQYPGAKPHGGDPGSATSRGKPPPSKSWNATRPTEQVITNARVTHQASGGGPPKQTPEPPKRDPSERKCYSCRRYEHIATDCSKTNPAGNFMVNEDPTSDSGPSKFLKTAIINGLDRVSRHPALVAELAEVLSIGQVEAADMMQRRFRSIQGLHDFMRLTGVVKGRVTSLPRDDGRTQLDDLKDDCWAHVKRSLALDDVP